MLELLLRDSDYLQHLIDGFVYLTEQQAWEILAVELNKTLGSETSEWSNFAANVAGVAKAIDDEAGGEIGITFNNENS